MASKSKAAARISCAANLSTSSDDEEQSPYESVTTYFTYAGRGNCEDVKLALRQSVYVFHGMNWIYYESNPDSSKEYCEYARHCIGSVWMDSVRTLIEGEMDGRSSRLISKMKLRVTNYLRPFFPGASSAVSKKLAHKMKPYLSDKNGKCLDGSLGYFIANQLFTHCMSKTDISIEARKTFRDQQLAIVVKEGGDNLGAIPTFLRSPDDSVEDEEDEEEDPEVVERDAKRRCALMRANEGTKEHCFNSVLSQI